MEHKKLLKEIQSLEANLEYHRRDLKKYFRKLKSQHGINPSKIEKRMEEVDNEIQELLEKEEKLKKKISIKLRGIKHARRSGRI